MNLIEQDCHEMPVRAKHIIDAEDYGSNCNCALARAAKGYFKADYVSEGVDNITIFPEYGGGYTSYSHEEYHINDFEKDRKKALKMNPNDIVRTVKLYKIHD